MFHIATILTFIAASAAIVIVPGPTVSLVVANSLRAGSAAGLANVLGTQIGLLLMIAIVAAGLEVVVAAMGEAFVVVKILGALYLVWLGIRLWRGNGDVAGVRGDDRGFGGYVVQGLLVAMSNPKVLLFFGAFLPQFVDPAHPAAVQVLAYGLIFMAVAAVLDGGYAFAAGRTGRLLTRGRIRVVEKVSGSLLIAGGVGLAFARR